MPCSLGRQIADLTFFAAVTNLAAARHRVEGFRCNLVRLADVDVSLVHYYWLVGCVESGLILAQQQGSAEPVREHMGYLETLCKGMG